MYYGMLSSEGIKDPLLLNTFKPIKVVIDYQPNSGATYWHRYLLQLSDEDLHNALDKISPLMKDGWYSIFWNESAVYVVLTNKIFKLTKEANWKSDEYMKVRKYAIEHGVQEEYMDFNDRFRHYKELLENT